MCEKDYMQVYENNKDFKEYVDNFLRTRDMTIEEALQHKMVKEIADFYERKNS